MLGKVEFQGFWISCAKVMEMEVHRDVSASSGKALAMVVVLVRWKISLDGVMMAKGTPVAVRGF